MEDRQLKFNVSNVININSISIFIIIIGVVLRLRQFSIDRSFWLDEASLVNNIAHHSLHYLLTTPLDNAQVAPIGFLLALKVIGKISGYQDQLLRLIPLFSGLLILPVSLFLRNRFAHRLSYYLFLIMMSISPVLIYYSSELKQYETDTFFCIMLLATGLNYRNWKFGHILLLLLGVIAIFCSTISIALLGSIGILEFSKSFLQKDKRTMKIVAAIGICWFTAFLFNFFLFLHINSNNTFLTNYWENLFAPVPTSLTSILWYPNSLAKIASLGFLTTAPIPISIQLIYYSYIPLSYILLAAMLLGSIFLYHHDSSWFFLNLLTIIFALLFSALKLYPIGSRPSLYIVPICFAFLSFFIDSLLSLSFGFHRPIGYFLATLIITILFIPATNLFLHPINIEDIKNPLMYIESHYHENDLIAISDWSIPAFDFYSSLYQLDSAARGPTISTQDDPVSFMQDVCSNKQFGRIWVIFSHRFSEAKYFIDFLSMKTPLLTKWEGPGSGTYLFNFSPNLCN